MICGDQIQGNACYRTRDAATLTTPAETMANRLVRAPARHCIRQHIEANGDSQSPTRYALSHLTWIGAAGTAGAVGVGGTTGGKPDPCENVKPSAQSYDKVNEFISVPPIPAPR